MKNYSIISYVSFSLVIGFLIILIFIHIVNSEINILKYPVSFYAISNYGRLLKIGLFMIALSEIILAIKLYFQNKTKNRLVSILLFIAGIAVLFVGVFPMDPEEKRTVSGIIHIYSAALHFVFFSLSVIIYGTKQSKNKEKIYSLFTGYFTFFLAIVMLLILRNEESIIFNYYGLVQKLDILIIITWLALISLLSIKRNN